MFSFQNIGNRFKYRLFSISNLSGFNKSSNYRLLSILLAQHCSSNKCSFQMQQFAKSAAQQKQQFCLFQNSPNVASSMSPTLDVEKATATNLIGKKEVEAKRQQQLEETEKQVKFTESKPIQTGAVNVQKLIAERFYPRQTIQETLIIRYRMGKSGWKFLDIEKGSGQAVSNYAHILVPGDIFGFVRAMDKILEAVHANKKSIIEASTKSQGQIMLHIANTKGENNDYQLKLHIVNNSVSVQMRTVPNERKPEHKPKLLALSLHKFHWLRTAIGELFAGNSEKEFQLRLGEPLDYPSWLGNLVIPTRNSLKGQQSILTKPMPIRNETVNLQKLIAKRIYPRQTIQEAFSVNYRMGKSGRKFLQFEKGTGGIYKNFPNIIVPDDLICFVRAMDEVLKAVNVNKKSIIEASTKSLGSLLLHIANAKGTAFDFQLKLHIVNNTVSVQMHTLPNEHKPEHIRKYMYLSLHQFHWLRHTIGELLAGNGEKEVQRYLVKPPDYSNWLANLDNPTRNLLPRRGLQKRQPQNKNNIIQRQNPLHNNRRNLQLKQSRNNFVRPAQRKVPQRVAPVQQQPAQQMKKEVSSSSPPSEEMTEQLLQLVFLQQQQLQQIQSAILKDQPMGGVGGAIAQKMGPDSTILMSDLLAQAPTQPQIAMPKWNGNKNDGFRKNWSGDRWNNQGFRSDDQY